MHNSKILVAAMAVKWLRAYDLRVPASASNNPTVVMSARGIISLVPDPFDNHRFASVGDDGMVRIWDLRQASEPFLTFSSEDGIAKHSKDRAGLGRTTSKISLATTGAGSAVTGDVTTVLYSTTRRGHIATLDRDSNYLSAWNIFEVGGKPERELFTPTTPHDGTGDEDSDNDSNAPVPTLYYERRSQSISLLVGGVISRLSFSHSWAFPSTPLLFCFRTWFGRPTAIRNGEQGRHGGVLRD